jgi:hypothetical protein
MAEEEPALAEIRLSDRVADRFVAIFVTITLVLFIVLVGAVIYLIIAQARYTNQIITQVAAAQAASDHRWCTTTNLLTISPVAPPVDPAANPSRVAIYNLYLDFLDLRKAFNCT